MGQSVDMFRNLFIAICGEFYIDFLFEHPLLNNISSHRNSEEASWDRVPGNDDEEEAAAEESVHCSDKNIHKMIA